MSLNYPIGKWLSKIYKHNRKYISERLTSYNLNSSEASLLMYLYSEGDGINQDEIAIDMGLDKATISRVIKQLVDKDYIIRKKSSEDKRVYIVHLNDKANSIKSIISNTYQSWFTLITEDIPEKEVDVILKNLEKMFNKVKNE
ncbi:MarR family winged helix-turn-helix transcriptional regulator [Selenihalanaerobacter shriftii]|uniref:DNA-binding transcriptional regulator, MarR family n=1 Tax=Selenihalanaerobacter shriftii TaxID=142842 RepID=A0A1T4JU19_9FIRM|nr:MarR family transcriptional regulator [Selenihalanaerobacter shriftii]SJZ33641.1 DNA-binding transcriptional regulator, MarR family [Selenihalanaerobacter shriftii]